MRSDGASRAGKRATLLLVAILGTSAGSAAGASTTAAGDADCDGRLNAADVTAVVDVIFEGNQCPAADVNGDALVSAADLTAEVVLLVAAGAVASPTATPKPVPTFTGTSGPSASPTVTETPSPTPTQPRTATVTGTPASTTPPTPTSTVTKTPTITTTPTIALTPSPTPTPSSLGPQIVYFGLATTDGCIYCTNPGCDCAGFPTPTPYVPGPTPQIFSGNGGQFRIVVEARPGSSGQAVTTEPAVLCGAPADPNLQIEGTQDMGNGSSPVCSPNGATNIKGGIPGINPPDFSLTPSILNTLQSFAIWFTYQSPGSACTFVPGGGSYAYVSPAATAQFCDVMNQAQSFPPGDSLLTVRVKDQAGNIGPIAQIIVRVATRTPTPTVPTATPTATRPSAPLT